VVTYWLRGSILVWRSRYSLMSADTMRQLYSIMGAPEKYIKGPPERRQTTLASLGGSRLKKLRRGLEEVTMLASGVTGTSHLDCRVIMSRVFQIGKIVFCFREATARTPMPTCFGFKFRLVEPTSDPNVEMEILVHR
jgi:hypothetical protein